MHWKSRVGVFLFVACLSALLAQTGFFVRQAEQVLSLLFVLRGEQQISQEIVIVGIDEHSIDELGPWPFPREKHALLFERLREARAVGFDIIFAEKSEEMRLLASEGVPVVMAAAASYEGKMLAPDVSSNPWIKLGHIETELGRDGIVRRVILHKNGLPSFALAMAGAKWIEDADAMRLINFYGPEFTFPYLSYSDVVQGKYPVGFFKDRYVLIGAKAIGLGDVHMIPFSRVRPVPGVEIQATILNNLFDSCFLQTFSFFQQFLAALSLLAGLLLLFPLYSLGRDLLMVGAVLVVLAGLSWLLFTQNLFFDPFFPAVVAVLGYLLHAAVVWMSVTSDVLREIRELNRKLEEGTQAFFRTVPYPLISVVKGTGYGNRERFGGLDRHLERLNKGIQALFLQNGFVQHLVSAEAPPLVFWDKESGQIVVANSRFSTLWQSLKISAEPPDLATFFQILQENRVQKEHEKKSGASLAASQVKLGEELVCDIFLRVQGQRMYLRVVAHEVDDQAFGFKGVLASLTDVTEIRELERLKGEVMNIVSHELKLPLTTIMGYGEILADSLEGEEKKYALNIAYQAQRLNGMIVDFLDIARIESGKYMMNQFPFDFITVINDALAVVDAAAASKQISLKSELPAKVTPLMGDEALMTQLVINLLDNAVKFSPEKTVVTLKLKEQENEFYLFVADEGSGVADDEKKEIFNKFSRGAGKRRGTGFGLGLNFVAQVVESHGGSIWISDADGGGAVFHLRLPQRK